MTARLSGKYSLNRASGHARLAADVDDRRLAEAVGNQAAQCGVENGQTGVGRDGLGHDTDVATMAPVTAVPRDGIGAEYQGGVGRDGGRPLMTHPSPSRTAVVSVAPTGGATRSGVVTDSSRARILDADAIN
jgi:hypothetical protein